MNLGHPAVDQSRFTDAVVENEMSHSEVAAATKESRG